MDKSVDRVFHLVRRISESANSLNDRQLLQRFLDQSDQSAFEQLMRRHGSMVMGVCRRQLTNLHDAEDAFQACFLVLARKASTLAWQDSIGAWLYQVAYRVSLKTRMVVGRRRQAECRLEATPVAESCPEAHKIAACSEVNRIIDEEMQRLPARYRDPLVMCYLEGKSHEAVASELGLPRGSMARRLGQALDVLKDRLRGRGMALPGGLAAMLAASRTSAAVPHLLAETTVNAATQYLAGMPDSSSINTLAEGVIQAMNHSRIKMAGITLLVLGLLPGSWLLLWPQFTHVGNAGAAPSSAAVEPYLFWSGSNSQVIDAGYQRISSRRGWQNLWYAHLGKAPTPDQLPQVDFQKCMVVAIFQGKTTNCSGIQVVSVRETTDALRLRFVGQYYEAAGADEPTTAFGIFILPRISKALVLEENVQKARDEPAVWQVRIRQDAPQVGATKKNLTTREEMERIFQVVAGMPGFSLKGLPETSKEALKPYQDDGRDNVLRATLRDAINSLKKDNAKVTLQFDAPDANQEVTFKNSLEGIQKRVGLAQYNLAVFLDELKMLSNHREKESKNWQAIYEYVCARLELRIGYLHEYNAALGRMRKEFPPRDAKLHSGWQLVARERASDRDALKNQRNANKHLSRLEQEHPGTPWAFIAGRTRASKFGLKWAPLPR